MLEVINPSLICTIQDTGRKHYMHMGVSYSGALDPLSLHLANRLVGNEANAAVLEFIMPPATFKFHREAWMALTGSLAMATLDGEPISFGKRLKVKKDQVLELDTINSGLCCYLAIDGGFVVPSLMNSSATDLKAGFGGHHPQGMCVMAGDQLALGKPNQTLTQELAIELPAWNNCLRAITGPEYDQFDSASQQSFFTQEWCIDYDSNRMGLRLLGTPLVRTQNLDILSQGVLPGVIQVPPNGQPIILAAEAQTTGGYPRVATIIQADFWKLGQATIGQSLVFEKCTIEDAKQALLQQRAYLDDIETILKTTR